MNSSLTEVTVTWQPGFSGFLPAAGGNQTFAVRYRKRGEVGWRGAPAGSNNRLTLSNLEPGRTYELEVRPSNKFGRGFDSEVVMVTTKGMESALFVSFEADVCSDC